MQEHLEKFPTHKKNTTEHQVKSLNSDLQDIFQNLHETPTNSNFFHTIQRCFNKMLILFQLI